MAIEIRTVDKIRPGPVLMIKLNDITSKRVRMWLRSPITSWMAYFKSVWRYLFIVDVISEFRWWRSSDNMMIIIITRITTVRSSYWEKDIDKKDVLEKSHRINTHCVQLCHCLNKNKPKFPPNSHSFEPEAVITTESKHRINLPESKAGKNLYRIFRQLLLASPRAARDPIAGRSHGDFSEEKGAQSEIVTREFII